MNGTNIARMRASNNLIRPWEAWTRAIIAKAKNNVDPLEPIVRLARYLSPQVAAAILNGDSEDPFKIRRREITVVFLDLRGFTSFSESAEPEEVAAVLRDYHSAMGHLIFKFGGTLEHFAGDGIMVFFNDPVPCADHAQRAVRMAMKMRKKMKSLREDWLRHGYDLDLGIGLVSGFATVGNIGFEGRMEYGAVGNVTNLASRLCNEAKGGQILTNQKTLSVLEPFVEVEALGELQLKGFVRPVIGFNILSLKHRLNTTFVANRGLQQLQRPFASKSPSR